VTVTAWSQSVTSASLIALATLALIGRCLLVTSGETGTAQRVARRSNTHFGRTNVIIYVIDYDYPRQESAPHLFTKDVKVLRAEKNESFSHLFNRVFHLVYEPVELLRLAAHMNAATIGLANDTFDRRHTHWFTMLRDVWKKDGDGIELHGCGVASDTGIVKKLRPVIVCRPGQRSPDGPGKTFLQAIADAAGAQVKGGVNCQRSDKWYRFEGPTVTVKPARAYPWKGPLFLTGDGKPLRLAP
jgi:hypothetical protein